MISVIRPFFAALVMSIPATIVALGQGNIARTALAAFYRQPAIRDQIIRLLLVGLALSETIALAASFVVYMLLRDLSGGPFATLIQAGAVCAVMVPAIIQGIGMSRAGSALIASVARQPEQASEGMSLFLITQTLGQTPLIFNSLVALAVLHQAPSVSDWLGAWKLSCIALIAAAGAIGPCIGLSRFATTLGHAYGYHAKSYQQLFSLALMSMALIETPFLLSLGFALFVAQTTVTGPLMVWALIMGILVIGCCHAAVCVGSARVCSQAAMASVQYPLQSIAVGRLSLLAQTFIDTSALYALLVAVLMIIML